MSKQKLTNGQPQWKPAQCAPPRHVYDTDGKRITSDTCRCGARKLKKAT